MSRLAACALALIAVLATACTSEASPSIAPATAFDGAVSTIAATQDLHVLVQSHDAAGAAELSDLVESSGGISLKARSKSGATELVVVGGRGWQRSSATGGQWTPLPDGQVSSVATSLNPGAEARCVRGQRGRLRSLGIRTFARQRAWALADDGSGDGGLKGTWFLTRTAPFRIIGFAGSGPAGSGTATDCPAAGPGLIQRLYSYEVAPAVTAPSEVATPPTTAG